MSTLSFRTKLTKLINQCSMENASNTPDFILANYIENCLTAFTEAIQQRETWYGRDATPSFTDTHKKKG